MSLFKHRWIPKFFYKKFDGGKESGVTGYFLIEWKAASERHNDGNILKSIEHNGQRFEMSPQLIRIFENTAKELF